MRHPKIILLTGTIVLVIAVALYFWWRHDSLYKWFQAHDRTYFMQVAGDCDLILKQHPVGSAQLDSNSRAPGWFSLPVTDATLPASIRALHPDPLDAESLERIGTFVKKYQ